MIKCFINDVGDDNFVYEDVDKEIIEITYNGEPMNVEKVTILKYEKDPKLEWGDPVRLEMVGVGYFDPEPSDDGHNEIVVKYKDGSEGRIEFDNWNIISDEIGNDKCHIKVGSPASFQWDDEE